MMNDHFSCAPYVLSSSCTFFLFLNLEKAVLSRRGSWFRVSSVEALDFSRLGFCFEAAACLPAVPFLDALGFPLTRDPSLPLALPLDLYPFELLVLLNSGASPRCSGIGILLISRPINFSILAYFNWSLLLTKVMASPLLSARAVLPTR